LELVFKWRSEEQKFRAWYAWVMEENTNLWETDRWMDEVGRLQQLVVDRDLPQAARRDEALLRLRRAHLFYPSVRSLQLDMQVQHSYVTAGIKEGTFVDSQLHSATTGECLALSQVLAQTDTQRVLVVAGSSS
jgi:hypothetical protein